MEEELKLTADELAALRQQLKREAKTKIVDFFEDEDTEEKVDATEEAEEEEEVDSKSVEVTVSEDKMSASIFLSYPAYGETYTVPEIMRELRSKGVISGIQTKVIMDSIQLGMYEEEIEVAVGTPETEGTEGYFEYLIDMEKRKQPDIREDGTVDYASMCRLTNVAAGDKIAVYHPAIQGTKGINVQGKPLTPKFVKDKPPLRGKYIEKNDDNEYFATIDGKISMSDNNVEILSVYEINEDLDMTKGTIEFYGDMIVNGNVESGVVIRAGRNITINGTVSGALIYSKGDVTITGGFIGGSKGKISSMGNVFCDFIEHGSVEAHGDIRANSSVNSTLEADGKVYLDGSRGVAIGGRIHGLRGVELRNCGTEVEPKTFIHAGFSVMDYQKFAKLNHRENKINTQLANAVSEMTTLLKIGRERGVNQKQKDRIFALNEEKDAAYQTLDEIARDKKTLGDKMAMAANAAIIVRGDIFPNSTIGIETSTLLIKEKKETFVRFVCKDEQIERRSVPKR